ncbi:MAG: formyltransferase family protein, partial [Dissulfurispiraceae bacterium]
MSLIFLGTPDFAVPSLRALISEKEDIALVVTQPDKLKGRGHVLSSPPVKETALAYGIKVIQPQKIRDEEFYHTVKEIAPEFVIVVAYGKILSEDVL